MVYEPAFSEFCDVDVGSRFRRRTRRIEDRGVECGTIGGKSDWKTVVVRFSRCFGTAGGGWPSWGVGEMKLFMTRRGGLRYSFPPPLACFCALWTSLQSEYFSTRKWRVGPRGVRARRRLVLALEDREKRRRCDTPRGPAMVV